MSIIELLQTRSLRTYGSGDTLSEHRALGQLGTVPERALAIWKGEAQWTGQTSGGKKPS